jgi:hypothetical protein
LAQWVIGRWSGTARSMITFQSGSTPSPPPTMLNTPCKRSLSRNARVHASIPNPDSANEVPNNKHQSVLDLREVGPVNDTLKIAQSPIVRPKKEKRDMEAYVVGVRDR